MSTSKTQRIVSFTLAVVFLVSTIGIVVFYVMTANQQDSQQQVIDKALQEAKANQQATTNPPKEGKLEGTKLTNFTPVASVPELQSTDTVAGDGDTVKAGDTVTVHYTGAIANNGTIFQSSKDTGQPISFGLDQVIKGWTQGVPGMKVGGTRRLVIPAALAYGANSPSANIPANADLVFDIELVKIGK